MIVPMKKAHIIVQDAYRTDAVRALSAIGLLHVQTDQGESERLQHRQKQLQYIERALTQLPPEPLEAAKSPAGFQFSGLSGAIELAERVHALGEETREHADQAARYLREIERMEPWGDFRLEDVQQLRLAGFAFQLRVVSAREWEARPAGLNAWVINRHKGSLYVAVITADQAADESAEPAAEWQAGRAISLPEMGLSQLRTAVQEHHRAEEHARKELELIAERGYILTQARDLLQEYTEFEGAQASMYTEEQLAVLSGYVPAESSQDLLAAARQHGWGIAIREPAADDAPPTKLRNPRWVRIIQPVFDLLGTVPGYREYDISALFLLFFAVFFGMIISDAGYGSLLLGGSLAVSLRARLKTGRIPDGLVLMNVLSLATVIWGSITGNWFGYEPIAQTFPFSAVVIDRLDSFNPRSIEFVQLFCFVLGAIHLGIAFLWNFTRALGGEHKLKSVAEVGWLTMVIGLFFMVLNVVLGRELPGFALYLILGGFALVTLFGEQEGNFFKGAAKGLANIMTNGLSSISRFSDIVSYIRLFAVGLASIEIAKSFNAMGIGAADSIENGVIGFIAGAFIIVLGHTINLFMAALSVVVHGVRLNMLEFSGALGMEWTGQIFRPFRARAPEEEVPTAGA